MLVPTTYRRVVHYGRVFFIRVCQDAFSFRILRSASDYFKYVGSGYWAKGVQRYPFYVEMHVRAVFGSYFGLDAYGLFDGGVISGERSYGGVTFYGFAFAS